MTEQLRVGLIGLGAVAAVHLEAYRSLSLVKVVAAALHCRVALLDQ